MTDDASAELDRRLRAGDELVLEDILRAHGPPIRAVLKRRTGGALSDSDCEDVFAISLFRLWQARERFDPLKASLRVWLFRIAENAAMDLRRVGWQKAKLLERSFEPVALAEVATMGPDDEESDERHFETEVTPRNGNSVSHELLGELSISSELLREVLLLLPDTQRRIVLADAQSRDGVAPSDELSKELGIPVGTVRVYRKRALDRLRREINARAVPK